MKQKITNKLITYQIEGKVWKVDGPAGWYFLSMEKSLSRHIRKEFFNSEEGWGRLKATLSLRKSNWNSAIWFDTKLECYLVPIKKEIRKIEGITDGTLIRLQVHLTLD